MSTRSGLGAGIGHIRNLGAGYRGAIAQESRRPTRVPRRVAYDVPGAAALLRPARDFAGDVRRVIASVAPGDVVTYGEVAREAGFEGAARAVGTLLARDGSDLPWWRVVTSTGRLVPGSESEQAARLRAEGVDVGGAPERVRRRGPSVWSEDPRRPADGPSSCSAK